MFIVVSGAKQIISNAIPLSTSQSLFFTLTLVDAKSLQFSDFVIPAESSSRLLNKNLLKILKDTNLPFKS